MPPSPPTSPRAGTSDSHMNDTTMPPPKQQTRYANQKGKGVVNVKARGPRFGLRDWKLLLKASKDLAQRKGAPVRRGIPIEEVRKHNKNYDGWIILRGRVYNVGPYLPYHPGGIEIFKNVLGKDATSLFDKYHRWVNIDGLIGPLLLGTVEIKSSSVTQGNQYSVVPTKETHLTNAPRISAQTIATSGSLLSSSPNDDEDDEEEPIILPP